MQRMHAPRETSASIRLDNALALFARRIRPQHHQASRRRRTLRGLEGRFAERLQIQPCYWSQIKGRSRQIGERLARQFEQLCHKPVGWMDAPHEAAARAAHAATAGAPSTAAAPPPSDSPLPQGRRRAASSPGSCSPTTGAILSVRAPRLLDLLGEVLMPRRRRGGRGARADARVPSARLPRHVPSRSAPACEGAGCRDARRSALRSGCEGPDRHRAAQEEALSEGMRHPLNEGCCLIDKALAQDEVLFIIAPSVDHQPRALGPHRCDVTPLLATSSHGPRRAPRVHRMSMSSNRTHLARTAACAARGMGAARAGIARRLASVSFKPVTRPA